ncbi:hypothetical protein ACFW81_08470 [Streptomyces angustmyceticus]|uniref:hypothetical protein n=1 Tax=Streptomyces angustmyceticus TaxID=285578 RepID=UPI00368F73FF
MRRYDRHGRLLGQLPIPENLEAYKIATRTFEGLTVDGRTLVASMEGWSTKDGTDGWTAHLYVTDPRRATDARAGRSPGWKAHPTTEDTLLWFQQRGRRAECAAADAAGAPEGVGGRRDRAGGRARRPPPGRVAAGGSAPGQRGLARGPRRLACHPRRDHRLVEFTTACPARRRPWPRGGTKLSRRILRSVREPHERCPPGPPSAPRGHRYRPPVAPPPTALRTVREHRMACAGAPPIRGGRSRLSAVRVSESGAQRRGSFTQVLWSSSSLASHR